jgi:hypothetical protein
MAKDLPILIVPMKKRGKVDHLGIKGLPKISPTRELPLSNLVGTWNV